MIKKMRKIYVLLLMFALCICGVQSKEKTNKINKKTNVESLKITVDSLLHELEIKDSIINTKDSLIDLYSDNLEEQSLKLTNEKEQKDSLLSLITKKDLEIASLKSNIGFVDTCMVKLANRWLFEKYDKSDIDEAIKYFDRIYSSKLKSDLSIVQKLLREYESSYKEFQDIIKEAQNDIDRENPFNCDEYKNKYMSKVKGMEYYIKYYNSDWNIRYLNAKIAEAIEIINNHSSNKFADFSHLIDYDL